MSFSNKNMKDLCDMFELNHLIKDPTCFKSSNPSCIDNFYTNKNTMFFNSSTVEKEKEKEKIRYNRQAFMSKTFRKAIIKWSKLQNTFNKKRSSEL